MLFGSIAGGSSFKFKLFNKRETGLWTTGTPAIPITLSLEEAIAIARKHRDQLIAGAELLEAFPLHATADQYLALQRQMDTIAPDVSDSVWGHNYFSLLYPDKLDSYHNFEYQRFHLFQTATTTTSKRWKIQISKILCCTF